DLPFTVSCVNDLDLKVQDITPAAGMSAERVDRRRALLASAGHITPPLAGGEGAVRACDVFQQRALDVLTSSSTRSPFALTREPAALRDRYGRANLAANITTQNGATDIAPNDYNRSVVGQSLLMARRLVESGVRFVTVIGRGWDTHADNFNGLKDRLLPY